MCVTPTHNTHPHTHKCAVFNGLSNFNIIVPGVYTHIHIIRNYLRLEISLFVASGLAPKIGRASGL